MCPSPHLQLARDPFQHHRRLRAQPVRNEHLLRVTLPSTPQVLRRPPDSLQFRSHDPACLLLPAPLQNSLERGEATTQKAKIKRFITIPEVTDWVRGVKRKAFSDDSSVF